MILHIRCWLYFLQDAEQCAEYIAYRHTDTSLPRKHGPSSLSTSSEFTDQEIGVNELSPRNPFLSANKLADDLVAHGMESLTNILEKFTSIRHAKNGVVRKYIL